MKTKNFNDPGIIEEYDLPDIWLFTDFSDFGLRKLVWIPQATVLVLGQSNDLELSVLLEKAEKDKVRIIRRPTGGESVLLTPEMVVVSILFTNINGIQSKKIFQIMGARIQSALEDIGVENISFKGISDLVIREQKILGSAIYRNPELLFYHAVLNVAEEPLMIAKYLHHPQREPDYRNNREHEMFVTSLRKEGYSLTVNEIREQIELYLQESFI